MRVGIDINRDISLSKVVGNGMDDKNSIPRRSSNFFSATIFRMSVGAFQLPFQWLLGFLSPKAKRPKHGTKDVSLPNSEDKKPPLRFMFLKGFA
jgi:hypothetical protein